MDEIFEAVTPDGKETEIDKVKVRMVSGGITAEDLAIVLKHIPDFKPPDPKMYRLELIDNEIATLTAKRDSAQEALDAQLSLRAKVELAAKMVVLAVQDKVGEPITP